MGDAGGEYERLTYQELAKRRRVSLDTARALVRRKGWHREEGNDGVVRITVPIEALTALPERPEKGPQDHQDSKELAAALAKTVEAMSALEKAREENTALHERLAQSEARAAENEARARAAEATLVEVRATLAIERERLNALTRPWWSRWLPLGAYKQGQS